MKRFALPLLAVLLLAGCAAPEPTAVSAETTGTATPTATMSPAPTPTSEIAPAEVAPAPVDMTAEVRDASPPLESYVKSATSSEAGRVSVESSLVDPRGDNGSAEAVLALQLCNDVVANMSGVSYLSIMENDGTTWILYGHPGYGSTCTEV